MFGWWENMVSMHWLKTWWPYVQEQIPIEEVFEYLKCTREGLTSEEGENRIQIFGPNKLEEKEANFFHFSLRALPRNSLARKSNVNLNESLKQESKILKFLGFMWNPLSWVMEAAAIMAIALANGGVIIIIKFYFFSNSLSGVFYMYVPSDWREKVWLSIDAGKASGLARFFGYHCVAHYQFNHQFRWRK